MITTNINGEPLSQEFKDALNQTLVSFDLRLVNNETVDPGVIQRGIIKLGSGTEYDNETADFTIGGTYSSQAEFKIYDTQIEIGDELSIQVGIANEYINIVNVLVVAKETWQGLSTVKTIGIIAGKLNQDAGLVEHHTVQEVVSAIQTVSGVTVTLGTFTSTPSDVYVNDGATCKEALENLALALGGFAAETNTGEIFISPFSEAPTFTLNPEYLTQQPTISSSNYVLDGLKITNDEGQVFTVGNGRVSLMYGNATQELVETLWDNVEDYTYRPATLNVGVIDPRVTPFDVISLTLDEAYIVPVRGISITYDGGYFGSYSASGLTEEEYETQPEGEVTKKANAAERAANEAKAAAEALSQYFWHNSNGAHVTDVIQQDYIYAEADGFPDWQPDPTQADYKPYYAVLLNSLGQIFQSAQYYIASFTHSAIAFFDGLGNSASNIVAQFGTDLARIGKEAQRHVNIAATTLGFYPENSNTDTDAYFFVGQAEESTDATTTATRDIFRLGQTSQQHIHATNTVFGLYPANASYWDGGAATTGLGIWDDSVFCITSTPNVRIGKVSNPHVLINSSSFGVYPALNNTANDAYFYANSSGVRLGAVGSGQINTYTTSSGFNIRSNTTNIGAFTYAANAKTYAVAPLTTDTTARDIVKLTTNSTSSRASVFAIDTPLFSVCQGSEGMNAGMFIGSGEARLWSTTAELRIGNTDAGVWNGWDGIYSFRNNYIVPGSIPVGARNSIRLRATLPNRNADFLRVIDGTDTGSAVVIGSGGLTIIGGGESATDLFNEFTTSAAQTETMHVIADTSTYIHSNANTIANRKTWTFNTSGDIKLPGGKMIPADYGNVTIVNGSNVSTTSGTAKSVAQITLEAGTWLVNAGFNIAANATGYRYMNFDTTSGSSGNTRLRTIRVQAPPTGACMQTISCVVTATTSTTYYCNVQQNSGSSLNASCYIQVVRLV